MQSTYLHFILRACESRPECLLLEQSMPYPTHLLESLKKEYPDRWREVASAMKNKNDPSYKQAVKTAAKPGHGGVTASIAKRKKTAQRMLEKGR